jgi:hypothetical protein
MTENHMKKFSTSLAIKEMQIKSRLWFHLTPLRVSIHKNMHNTHNNNFWQGFGDKCTLLHFWWECKLVQTLWKTV